MSNPMSDHTTFYDSRSRELVSSTGDYHPSYSSHDAHIILCSCDGVKFRVQPLIISLASEVFGNMIKDSKDMEEPISLQERSDVLKTLLDMVYPSGECINLTGKDFDFVWDLVIAADKYSLTRV